MPIGTSEVVTHETTATCLSGLIAPISAVTVSIAFPVGRDAFPSRPSTMELVTAIALHMMSSTDDHEGKYEADVDVGRSNPHLDRRLKKSSLFLQAGSD